MTDPDKLAALAERLRKGRLVRETSGCTGESRELPHDDALEAADLIEQQAALLAEAREVLSITAKRQTVEEALHCPERREWVGATVERRIEMMGESKREHDAMVLQARATIAKLGTQ